MLGPVGIFGQLVLHVPVAGLGSLAAEGDRATPGLRRPPEARGLGRPRKHPAVVWIPGDGVN